MHHGELPRDLAGADESLPLTTGCPSPYPTTKAIAEREVLAANSAALRTIALRPHLIWGVGDPHLVPRVLARARAVARRIDAAGPSSDRDRATAAWRAIVGTAPDAVRSESLAAFLGTQRSLVASEPPAGAADGIRRLRPSPGSPSFPSSSPSCRGRCIFFLCALLYSTCPDNARF